MMDPKIAKALYPKDIERQHELIDASLGKLIEQGKFSHKRQTYPPLAMYRGAYGCRCPIGFLIPDWAYNFSMEGKSVRVLMNEYPNLFNAVDIYLLTDIQGCHDRALTTYRLPPIEDWKEHMQILHEGVELGLWLVVREIVWSEKLMSLLY